MLIPFLARRIQSRMSLKRFHTLRTLSAPLPGPLSRLLRASVRTTAASAEAVALTSVVGPLAPDGSRPVIAGIASSERYKVDLVCLTEGALRPDAMLAALILGAAYCCSSCESGPRRRLKNALRSKFGRPRTWQGKS